MKFDELLIETIVHQIFEYLASWDRLERSTCRLEVCRAIQLRHQEVSKLLT
jgi:hypothetical protein